MIKESGINITKAAFPAPFESGLEYNPPTRGVWNIVHTGMLIPESRQIFVCAQGCYPHCGRDECHGQNVMGDCF